jgi:hypothetical protein
MAKVLKFQYTHDGTLSIRNYMLMLKKPGSPILNLYGLMAIIQPKSQNSNIDHDGALSIRNFVLIISPLVN